MRFRNSYNLNIMRKFLIISPILLFFIAGCFVYNKKEENKITMNSENKLLFNKGDIEVWGGTGTSTDDPLVILGAKNSSLGVAIEYMYIESIYGKRESDWKLIMQSLIRKDNKSFDCIQIKLKSGEEKRIYFDISDFFGKW